MVYQHKRVIDTIKKQTVKSKLFLKSIIFQHNLATYQKIIELSSTLKFAHHHALTQTSRELTAHYQNASGRTQHQKRRTQLIKVEQANKHRAYYRGRVCPAAPALLMMMVLKERGEEERLAGGVIGQRSGHGVVSERHAHEQLCPALGRLQLQAHTPPHHMHCTMPSTRHRVNSIQTMHNTNHGTTANISIGTKLR